MKYFSLFLCLSITGLLGCQNAPEAADAGESDEQEETTASSAPERPDPNNPSGENNAVPVDWVVRLDTPDPAVVIGANPDEADIFFVNMTPGWHITSGPAGIYYHPVSTASGTYTASMDVHLFDPGRRNEAFGLFIGGENLDADNQEYDYFLIRNSGEYLIKRRTGSETTVIQDWTASESINRYTAGMEDQSVMNRLTVDVGEDEVDFSINGTVVATLPESDVKTDGIVGFRVNHALNLHISDFSVDM